MPRPPLCTRAQGDLARALRSMIAFVEVAVRNTLDVHLAEWWSSVTVGRPVVAPQRCPVEVRTTQKRRTTRAIHQASRDDSTPQRLAASPPRRLGGAMLRRAPRAGRPDLGRDGDFGWRAASRCGRPAEDGQLTEMREWRWAPERHARRNGSWRGVLMHLSEGAGDADSRCPKHTTDHVRGSTSEQDPERLAERRCASAGEARESTTHPASIPKSEADWRT